MGLQTIINKCDSLTIDRRRVMGVQYTRSEVAKISETPTRNPWKFTLGISAALKYGENRALLESIDYLDRKHTEDISFSTTTGASTGLAYMFAYQGAMTLAQQNALRVSSFVGNQLILTNLPKSASLTGGANGIMFKSGDFIQIAGYPYPFTVLGGATASGLTPTLGDVKLSAATLDSSGNPQYLTVTVHRPNFITASVGGLGVNIGNNCVFRMFCPNMPTYKLTPGGDNAVIGWNSDFQLYEYLGDA
jgi:hypothetical protein